MSDTAFDDDREYVVVRNDEEQYSIWPAERPTPDGWVTAGPSGSKTLCLDYIEEVWTDIRPKSVREAGEH
jgi:MbtH protein